MGIRNVAAGFLVEPDKLTNGARITLLTLCMLSYDTPQHGIEARTYFGGWQMAMVRQGAWIDDAAKRRFVRHITELRAAGLVELVSPGRNGMTAVYRLHLPVDKLPISVDDDEL